MGKNERILKELLDKAKDELSLNQKIVQTLFEKSEDMILLVLPDGKITYASTSFKKVLGYELSELMAIPSYKLIHPEDLPGSAAERIKILNVHGASFTRQQRILHKNGSWVWCEGTVTNMLNEPGINAMVINFRTISERKLSEELLAKSEKRFRDFFEIAPESVIILDVSTGKFIECNTNTLVLLKFTPEEIFAKGPADISPEFQPCGRRSDEKALEYTQRAMAGEKMVVEWLAINALGETFTAEVRLVALDDPERPLIYASVIDITDRKETERQIMDQNMRLAEIAFMQSHQMRQPIASILGLISLFNFKNPADPLNLEVMKKIKDASKLSDNILHEIVTRTQPSKSRFKNV